MVGLWIGWVDKGVSLFPGKVHVTCTQEVWSVSPATSHAHNEMWWTVIGTHCDRHDATLGNLQGPGWLMSLDTSHLTHSTLFILICTFLSVHSLFTLWL